MQPLTRMIRLTALAPAALLSLVVQAQSEKTNTPYPSIAPIDRYLIPDAGAEISLAKSAAPKSVSDGVEVILLQRQGYQTAVQGTNGFVCMVPRSWAAGSTIRSFGTLESGHRFASMRRRHGRICPG
jgi:hypothetical protein